MATLSGAARRLLLTVIIGGTAVGACLAALLPGAEVLATSHHYTSDKLGKLRDLAQRSTVYDSKGNQIAILGIQNRQEVPLSEVPQVLINAVVATEDKTFWTNDGIDLNAVFRAFVKNVTSGEIEQGGSTITQQLVKNRLLNNRRDINRKIREIVLALRLNEKYTKKEILEQYLNTVYFGRGLRAVRALPEVHGVEVLLEDLLLRVLLVEAEREHDLTDLAVDVAPVVEQPVLHELLGDRRATLLDLARRDVLDERAEDRVEVDAVVGPERLVLGGDDRVDQHLRHLGERDLLAVLDAEDRDLVALRVVHRGTLREVAQLAELVARVVVAGREHLGAREQRGQAGADRRPADDHGQQEAARSTGERGHDASMMADGPGPAFVRLPVPGPGQASHPLYRVRSW